MNQLPASVTILLNVLGGLTIFLFAMRLLSGHLQNIIGGRIEYVLRKMTDRPHKGMVVGAFVTFLTQSSSITVLTLIGLVNIGALSLHQGVGVVLGSEIGTTITAQLVAFNIGLLYLPLIILGFALSTFTQRKSLDQVGKVIFSFGLLFMGMALMKQGTSPLKDTPLAFSLFERFSQNPLLGILGGAIFTGITSSSSATTSLVVALGASNVITLPAGISLILGANLGTCLLELIAVVGMSLTAKRVAVSQAVINLLGVILILPFIYPFAEFMSSSAGTLSRQIANSHTVFNVGSSTLFLLLVGIIVSISKRLVPGEVIQIERGTKYLDPNILKMPHIALAHAAKEIRRAGEIVLKMISFTKDALLHDRDDLIELVYNYEDQVDFLNEEISRYLTLISEHELDAHSSTRLAQLLHGISDIERASDHINRVAEQAEIKIRNKLTFPSPTKGEIANFITDSARVFKNSLDVFILDKPHQAPRIYNQVLKLRSKRKKIRGRSARWGKRKGEIYSQILYHLERAATHANNIAQTTVSGF